MTPVKSFVRRNSIEHLVRLLRPVTGRKSPSQKYKGLEAAPELAILEQPRAVFHPGGYGTAGNYMFV
jgi:hypothetical protein